MMRGLRSLFRRQPSPNFRVGDLVRYRGRCRAISDIAAGCARLVWLDNAGHLHTDGFVPFASLRVWVE
jgi:hypothetical protein